MTPKYPEVTVRLTGEDGNAFAILGAVRREMRRNKIGEDEQQAFVDEATSGNYDHLLQTCMRWVNVE